MSLELIQGYSSAEEEEDEQQRSESDSPSSSLSGGDGDEEDDDGGGVAVTRSRGRRKRPLSPDPAKPSPNSSLPSALDAFAEIAGPPQFLNNCVAAPEEPAAVLGAIYRRGRHKSRREKKDLPAGAVVEAKAQMVGIRDRVRNDVEGSCHTSGSVPTISTEGKRLITASNPEAKDAADLLRMCLQCGIPKTYSHARGMVCPVCGDRPPADPTKELERRKGSIIKDKEKSKRMKGQSSHATWKSETEMQLRQQFD